METVTDACWALSYLSDGPNDRISAVLSNGIAPKLVELLGNTDAAVQTPALRTVGNIVTGDDKQTQVVINLNALPALLQLLDNPKKNIRKEACWTISNITAGTQDQIQAVINAGIVPKLIDLLRTQEFDIQKEAAWAISNATSGGTPHQIYYLAHMGCIPPLCNLLNAPDIKIVKVALEGLENILRMTLQAGDEVKQQVVNIIHECNGTEAIENLQSHEDSAIYNRAIKIIETYFDVDEEGDSKIIPDVNVDASVFSFGGAQVQTPKGGFSFGN